MYDGKTQYLPTVHKSADIITDRSVIGVGVVTITLCDVFSLCVFTDRHLD